MNIFTIITTILGLSIDIWTILKSNNQIYNQTNNTIIDKIIINILPSNTYDKKDYIKKDNHNFKVSSTYSFITLIHMIIFIIWFIYGYKKIYTHNNYKLIESTFFAILNTIKSTIPSIFLLSTILVYKNYKNENSNYRILHIICYSLLSICIAINLILLFQTNNQWFLINSNTFISPTNILYNLITILRPMFPLIELTIILYYSFTLSYSCIWGEYKSELLRINTKHIIYCIIAPIIYALMIFYLIILKLIM